MTEKDAFVQAYDREFATTMKVVQAYPTGKLDLRPAEKSRTAKDLAWTFVGVEYFLDGVVKGTIDVGEQNGLPATLQEILDGYRNAHREVRERLSALSEEDFQKPIKFHTGPGKVGDVPRNQVLWMVLNDVIHHRGQFSVYLRMAGGKVPSIYGPTADEPWM